MLKILHIDTERGWRGGEQQVLLLAKGLKENGIESSVACLQKDHLWNRCLESDINTVPLTGNQISDAIKIATIGGNFSIIHAHASKSLNMAIMSKPFHKRPVIYTRRVDYKPSKNPITRVKYRNTEKIVCVVKEIENILLGYGIPEEKLTTIHSAVDTALSGKIDTDKVGRIKSNIGGKLIIGNVGALTRQKNQLNFIKACQILAEKYPHARFIIIGDGPLKNRLINEIKKINMHDRIKLLGFKKDIQNYIKAMDIFVLSSDNEGIGGTILQAMILRVPVVSTDVGGVKEAVTNGNTGILVKKNDPEALASGITRLLENPELKKTLVNNAFYVASEKFSVDKMVGAYIRVYMEVAGCHPLSSGKTYRLKSKST